MKSRATWIVLAVAACALVAGGASWWWWRTQERAAILAESVPARPDLSGWPAELAERIAACEARVGTGRDPIPALGELARLYHANGFHGEASVCYQALVLLDKGNPRWPHGLAGILAGYGRLDEAADLWRHVIELAPGYLPARIRLGDTLVKTNRLEEARRVYEAALAVDPQHPYAHLGIGRILVASEQWKEARAPLEQAASLTGNRLAIDLLPTVYEHLGDDGRARSIRGQAKAMGSYSDPPDPWLDELMLDCYDTYRLAVAAGAAKHGGNRAGAMRLLERALSLSPDSAPIHFQIGTSYLESREYSKARPHLEACTRLAPDFADGWLNLSNLLATIGDRAASERILAEGLRHNPTSPSLHFERANRLTASGAIDEAIAAYEESLRLRPDEALPLLSIARILSGQGRDDEAAARLRRAVEVEPGYPPALAILAFHAIQSGNESEARKWLAQVRLQPRVGRDERQQLEAAFRSKFGVSP